MSLPKSFGIRMEPFKHFSTLTLCSFQIRNRLTGAGVMNILSLHVVGAITYYGMAHKAYSTLKNRMSEKTLALLPDHTLYWAG